MKREELFNIIGEVDEQKVAAAAGMAINTKKKSRSVWYKWGALAACLCLLVIGAVLFKLTAPPSVISRYDAGIEGSYIVPEPGEYYCFIDVYEAREHYAGKDVRFLLTFDLFKSTNEILSDEEKNAEYQRLTELGYKLYQTEYWTYKDNAEKAVYPIVVGLFTEEELATFNANPIYGYAFRFVTNGDSSSISIEESDLITEFSDCNIK